MLGILSTRRLADTQHGAFNEDFLHERGGQQGLHSQDVPQEPKQVHGGQADGTGLQQAECISDILGLVWQSQ